MLQFQKTNFTQFEELEDTLIKFLYGFLDIARGYTIFDTAISA